MAQKILNATPEKRIFLSIISEYDLKRSICELIDNAIDLWSKSKDTKLIIRIVVDESQQSILIEDNAGGIEESKLDHVVSPGKTTNDISDGVIGYFGVGSKRAVIALAQEISIHSRFSNKKSYTVKLDEHWITNDASWNLPYTESNTSLQPNTTLIELNRLRMRITTEDTTALKRHLAEVYAKFLDNGAEIKVNDSKITPINFDDQWSYPPNFCPSKFSSTISLEDRNIEIEMLSGLIDHPGDPDKSYGVFIYCNNRLIARGLTDFAVGFSSGLVGNPHYNISLARTIVKINGQSRDMPWDSSKSGLNLKHPTFQALQQSIIDVTKKYSQVSRSLQGKWDSEVFPHKAGKVTEEKLESIKNIPKSYLPTPPASKQKWSQAVIAANADIMKKKPWSGGLLESVVAVDQISKGSLNQKNRIAFIVLDSSIEIAYKEYLVNETSIGNARFKAIAENRADVQKEVLKTLKISAEDLKKIDHYYKLRCDLIHLRATPNITDDQITDYRTIVEKILKKMFGLKFAVT
ncbi:MAG: ATP-binding protein [Burkholderiaceae bacterium]